MALPARVFWKLEKLADRWDCAPGDIAGWATEGLIEVITSVGKVECDGAEPQGGLVVVCAEDIMPLFRSDGARRKTCRIWRIRRPGWLGAWQIINDPAKGAIIELPDLLVTAKMVKRFEDKYDPLHRVHISPGPSTRHDWAGMFEALMIRVFEHGLPETQTALIAEGQSWFVANAKGGLVPDQSHIRRKIAPAWRN